MADTFLVKVECAECSTWIGEIATDGTRIVRVTATRSAELTAGPRVFNARARMYGSQIELKCECGHVWRQTCWAAGGT